MINFKKGPALSLHQINYVGVPNNESGANIEAGMIVRLEPNGAVTEVKKGSSVATAKDELLGFAINSQTAGDVIESGVIGVYALDGASVIETDKFVGDASSYSLGDLLTAEAGTGNVKAAGGSDRVIGQVEGSRSIPGVTQVINGYKVQGVITVLGVKLYS